MKLYLIFVLFVLMPIVTAKSVARFLYSHDSKNNYLLGYAYDVNELKFGKLLGGYGLVFSIERNTFGKRPYWEDNEIRLSAEDFYLNHLSFAVESFVDEKHNSSESLEYLIDGVWKNMIIRELTDEERWELEAYKQRQKKKGKWNFKLVYRARDLKMESCGWESMEIMIRPDHYYVLDSLDLMATEADTYKEYKMQVKHEQLLDQSFVIEYLPNATRECTHNVANRIFFCQGKTGFRDATKDD